MGHLRYGIDEITIVQHSVIHNLLSEKGHGFFIIWSWKSHGI